MTNAEHEFAAPDELGEPGVSQLKRLWRAAREPANHCGEQISGAFIGLASETTPMA